jgi:hypothetical protein
VYARLKKNIKDFLFLLVFAFGWVKTWLVKISGRASGLSYGSVKGGVHGRMNYKDTEPNMSAFL